MRLWVIRLFDLLVFMFFSGILLKDCQHLLYLIWSLTTTQHGHLCLILWKMLMSKPWRFAYSESLAVTLIFFSFLCFRKLMLLFELFFSRFVFPLLLSLASFRRCCGFLNLFPMLRHCGLFLRLISVPLVKHYLVIYSPCQILNVPRPMGLLHVVCLKITQ